MKIISWNCNMAFRNKCQHILDLKPDLLIVIECEAKEKLEIALQDQDHHRIQWYGDNPHKGIAIIEFQDYNIQLNPTYTPKFRYIIPFTMGADANVNLFVIWAMADPKSPLKSYVGQIWQAIHHYATILDEPSILIGDFNSNAIWDNSRKSGNHTLVIDFLNKKNITSLYHRQTGENHGQETQPTFFLYRHEDKSYHMDYCCTSVSLIGDDTTIDVGRYEDWIGLSDHTPVIVESLNIFNNKRP